MNLEDIELNFNKVKKTNTNFHFVLNEGADEKSNAMNNTGFGT